MYFLLHQSQLNTCLVFSNQNQCDQIRRNFTKMGNVLKALGNCLRVYFLFGKCRTLFGHFSMLLCIFLVYKWTNIGKIKYPSGHTDQNERRGETFTQKRQDPWSSG